MLRFERIRCHSFIPGLLPGDCQVVDLGANRGDFSRSIGSKFGWRCCAVEASPEVFETIQANGPVRKFNVAIGGREGPVVLHVAENSEESSIVDAGKSSSKGSVTVDGTTLGGLMRTAGIDRIDLLKVDIEGAEIEMFDSLSDEQLRAVTQICVEFHDFNGRASVDDVRRISERLERLGFERLKMSATTNGDVLFVNRALAGVSRLSLWRLKFVNRNLIFARRFWDRKILGRANHEDGH